ncbi:MAG: hypothetical protein WDO24_07425 [Pseudomonadota bacterium]
MLKPIAFSLLVVLALAGPAGAWESASPSAAAGAPAQAEQLATIPVGEAAKPVAVPSNAGRITDGGRRVALHATTDQLGTRSIAGWSAPGESSTARDSALWLAPQIGD